MKLDIFDLPPVALDAPDVIRVDGLVKRFVLRHTRSMKEAFIWLIKGRKGDLSERFSALNGVSMKIREGERVALLGYNGSGKSTMLKLISGVMQPDQGSVLTRGRIAGLIEVGAGFHPDLTGRDNVYLNAAILGMSKEQTDALFDEIVAFSEIGDFIDTEVKFYSSGMYLRLAFAVAIHTDPEIFLVDEILAVGDEPFQKKCLQKIKELCATGKTLVVVSHDLDLVSQICDRGIVLEKGNVRFDGDAMEAVDVMRDQPLGTTKKHRYEGDILVAQQKLETLVHNKRDLEQAIASGSQEPVLVALIGIAEETQAELDALGNHQKLDIVNSEIDRLTKKRARLQGELAKYMQ
ncbi:ABC transporter ATP-binding protein [Rothia sp. ZJ1223]|nr:ABC transporter ATP-binding protein [Rothia sp. ZJ1223]MBM7050831.1 ABC transporter ATP-binding protein [Rothia sp. ZJ1223]